MYADRQAKNHALLGLLRYLIEHSEGPLPGNPERYDRHAAAQKAYDDAAQRLQAILDTPVAPAEPGPEGPWLPDVLRMEFPPEAMCVVVVAPMGALGVERTLTFDRDTRSFMQEEPDAVDRWTRLVAAAMLRDALDQLGV